MLKQTRSILALSILVLSASFSSAGIDFLNLSLEEAKVKAKAENKLLFIDVYATWCGPCKYLDRTVFPNDDLGDYMNANFINLHLDGEKGDGLQLMIDYQLDSYPTMLFIDSEGVQKTKIVGSEDAQAIKKVAMGVLDPTSTPLYIAKKKYEEGDHSHQALKDYVSELIYADDNENAEIIANVFVDKFPDIKNYDEEEFRIFYMSSDKMSASVVKMFLDNIETYKALYEQYTFEKLKNVISTLIVEACNQKDPELIKNQIDYLFPVVRKVYEDEFSKEEFEQLLLESYESCIEEE